jgi:hypothetical protein
LRNKANLYKLSKPNDIQINFDTKVPFRIVIGTFESNRIVNVEAYNMKQAINEALTYCKDFELVLEVIKDGQILWKYS